LWKFARAKIAAAMSIASVRTTILQRPFLWAFAVAVALSLPGMIKAPAIGGSKHDGYLELAQNIARGNGYVFEAGGAKVFHRPPLYATLLAPGTLLPRVMWPLYVVILNAACFAATAGLLLRATRRHVGERAAVCAWPIFVLNPFALYTIKNPMPPHAQTLAYLLITVLGVEFAMRLWHRDPPCGRFLFGYLGALFGGAMCHGTMLMNAALWLGILAVIAIYRGRGKGLLEVAVCGICLLMLIAPWTWRNYRVTGLFLPVAGNVGVAYFAGNAHWGITGPPEARDETKAQALFRHAGLPPETKLEYYGLVDPQDEKFINAKFSEHAKTHLGALLRKSFLNADEYFFPITYYILMRREMPLEPLAISFYFAMLLGLAAFGFFLLWRRKETRLVAIATVLFALAYAVPYFPFLTFVGHSLYTFGTIPFFAALGGVALARGGS
jgi:hypothetical protein